MFISRTVTINEEEIRFAVAEWLAAQTAGDGPRVDPQNIKFIITRNTTRSDDQETINATVRY